MADKFDMNTVYVSFDNRKRDDFKPYILKSTDRVKHGNLWFPIFRKTRRFIPWSRTMRFSRCYLQVLNSAAFSHSMVEGSGQQLKSGMPAMAVRDMVIQERENDLVLATFGRGFYILDDYTPLRELAQDMAIKESDAHIFDVPVAKMFSMTPVAGMVRVHPTIQHPIRIWCCDQLLFKRGAEDNEG